jgi:hypothetical protein
VGVVIYSSESLHMNIDCIYLSTTIVANITFVLQVAESRLEESKDL